MRTLIAALAALIAVGTASPALAIAPPAASGVAGAGQWLVDVGAAGFTVVRKKKKETATIKTVTGAKKGKPVKIRVKVARADRVCEMELEWNDGSAPEIEDAEAGTNKYCTFSVEVPDDEEVEGKATFTVTVKSATGKKLTEVDGSFTVK